MLTFNIEDKVLKQINEWVRTEVYPAVIKQQQENIKQDNPSYKLYKDGWDYGIPYEGTIGGRLKYTFTRTSLGDALTVQYGEYSQDFTAYEDW
jgi:hypothetical protein